MEITDIIIMQGLTDILNFYYCRFDVDGFYSGSLTDILNFYYCRFGEVLADVLV